MKRDGREWHKWRWPILCAFGCVMFGTLSGLLTVPGIGSWYRGLTSPPGTPPGWVFGPVWSVLYLAMGVALGRLIFQKAWNAVRLFGVQFCLNLAWTPVFFGAHLAGVALVVIALLWMTLLATILLAKKTDRVAAGLLVPYLAWVSYASYLNAGFFFLNR